MNTRILLADDQELFLDGLRALLEQESDLEVVGEGRDGQEAQRAARELDPDLVVMDIGMPGLNGFEATHRIAEELRGVKVLILSIHQEARVIQSAFEAGASGYLLKDCAADESGAGSSGSDGRKELRQLGRREYNGRRSQVPPSVIADL